MLGEHITCFAFVVDLIFSFFFFFLFVSYPAVILLEPNHIKLYLFEYQNISHQVISLKKIRLGDKFRRELCCISSHLQIRPLTGAIYGRTKNAD